MPYDLTNFHPGKGHTPEHVGLIPDGIRRWAKRNNIPLLEAYLEAMHKIAQCIGLFFGEGSQAVSIYLSSIQNFRRSEREVSAIFQAETMLLA